MAKSYRTIGHYILEGKKPKEVDLLEWGKWFKNNMKERIVKQEELSNGKWVSTVFLGIDHNCSLVGPPLLFETMVFAYKRGDEIYTERYATYKEAEKGHKRIVTKFLFD